MTTQTTREMTTYAVRYQLHDSPVSRRHRSLAAAQRDLDRCRASARRGGDCQDIWIEDNDGRRIED